MDGDAVQKEKQGSTRLKFSIFGCFDGSNHGRPSLSYRSGKLASYSNYRDK